MIRGLFMDRNTVLGVTAIICLTILGVFIGVYIPEMSKVLYAIVAAISGIAGFCIPRAISKLREIKKK